MTNPVELIPLLVVALVLLSAGGADVSTITIAADGERTVADVEEVLVVGGGTATIPADERVNGSIYIIGGDAVVAGEVDGDVVQLAGNLTIPAEATITGELRLIAGERVVASEAVIGQRTDFPTTVPVRRSPVEQVGFLAVQALVLALAGWALARRNAALLRNVGDAMAEHSVVSGTVGLLASATGVALVVFMAITVLLLPVSLLGIVVGFVVVGYAYVAFGYLLGRRLPVERVGRATAGGVVAFVVLMEGLSQVPLVGAMAQLLLVLIGFGAVLITYFGLRGFEPVELPG